MSNIYFELTREFNAAGVVAALTSGQAVVYYRIAMMSKDGDWIVRETEAATGRVLEVLACRGARYRAGAPLAVDWLRGGWSSHLVFHDPVGRRVRCDFFSRPPRLSSHEIDALFSAELPDDRLLVIGVEALIRMKQTQRAQDYPFVAGLAGLLPPEREIELTTDPDRLLELAGRFGGASPRPAVSAARDGDRRRVVIELALEIDAMQQADRVRLARYARAARGYLGEFQARRVELTGLPLPEAHRRLVALADKLLPRQLKEDGNGDAERGPAQHP